MKLMALTTLAPLAMNCACSTPDRHNGTTTQGFNQALGSNPGQNSAGQTGQPHVVQGGRYRSE